MVHQLLFHWSKLKYSSLHEKNKKYAFKQINFVNIGAFWSICCQNIHENIQNILNLKNQDIDISYIKLLFNQLLCNRFSQNQHTGPHAARRPCHGHFPVIFLQRKEKFKKWVLIGALFGFKDMSKNMFLQIYY